MCIVIPHTSSACGLVVREIRYHLINFNKSITVFSKLASSTQKFCCGRQYSAFLGPCYPQKIPPRHNTPGHGTDYPPGPMTPGHYTTKTHLPGLFTPRPIVPRPVHRKRGTGYREAILPRDIEHPKTHTLLRLFPPDFILSSGRYMAPTRD